MAENNNVTVSRKKYDKIKKIYASYLALLQENFEQKDQIKKLQDEYNEYTAFHSQWKTQVGAALDKIGREKNSHLDQVFSLLDQLEDEKQKLADSESKSSKESMKLLEEIKILKLQQQGWVLDQQIQMAVQVGHRNPQILNQPMAPQTLLNQLLEKIKELQQCQVQHASATAGGGNRCSRLNNQAQLAFSANITKHMKQIINLQNKIMDHQADNFDIHEPQSYQENKASSDFSDVEDDFVFVNIAQNSEEETNNCKHPGNKRGSTGIKVYKKHYN